MSAASQRPPRSRLPLGVILVLIATIAIWQYARSDHRPLPATATATALPPVAERSRPDESAAERHDLSVDERRGGHTLARHVGRTDAELAERLNRERGISAASTYTDRDAAETTVARALKQNEARVQSWMSRTGNHANLALDYRGRPSDVVGRSLPRGRRTTVACVDALVVLRWTDRDSYYVLTSYPEARR